MPALTKFSLLTNAVLVVLVWHLSRSAGVQPRQPSASVPTITTEWTKSEAAPIPAEPGNEPRPPAFHWSQLESTNYWTYVANLRNIGCPEQTIRDIVTADLDNAYYAPRRQTLQQLSAAADASDSPAVEAEAQQLGNEESILLTRLLQPQAGVGQAGSVHGANQPDAAQTACINPASLPGVVSKPTGVASQPGASQPALSRASSPSAANRRPDDPLQQPTPVQPTQTPNIVGNASSGDSVPLPQSATDMNPDPAIAALRTKWELARRNADYSLRGLIGSQRYLEYVDQQYFNQAALAQ